MSKKAEFHRAICDLARDGSPAAEAILDTLLELAREELDKATARRLMLDGWERAHEKAERDLTNPF